MRKANPRGPIGWHDRLTIHEEDPWSISIPEEDPWSIPVPISISILEALFRYVNSGKTEKMQMREQDSRGARSVRRTS